jgi:hypothetical protein
MEAQGRMTTRNWDLYDTRHVVYRPARLSPEALEAGYNWAYREFYRWSSIARAAQTHESVKHQLKHLTYAAGWKKFERLWNLVIRLRQLGRMTPVLEAVLSKVTRRASSLPQDGCWIDASSAPGGKAAGQEADAGKDQGRGDERRRIAWLEPV